MEPQHEETKVTIMSKRTQEAVSDRGKRDFLTQLSDDLSLELCIRLPMKKLVQCMSVSKAWHSIIHHVLSTETYLCRSPCVLVAQHNGSFHYCSLGLVHEAEQFSKIYNFREAQKFTDVVKGLVCGYNSKHVFVCSLWSGEIMELPEFPGILQGFDYFFGFDPIKGLHKLLVMEKFPDNNERFSCYILTLGGADCSWRELDRTSNMPKPFSYEQTFVDDGVFYWLTTKRKIIGFNFEGEKFFFVDPPKMDESRFRFYKFTRFQGRLAMYYTVAHIKLMIHTLNDDKGIVWTKYEIIYQHELKCRLRIRVVPLPSGDILLMNGENEGCFTSAYSYNYHNDKFEKFVLGKWPHYKRGDGNRLEEGVNISCEVPNFRRRYQ